MRLEALELALLDGRPEWMDQGACVGHPLELWFPPPGNVSDGNIAKRICHGCPVQQLCLDYAMTFGPRGLAGIWGGMSERQRILIYRNRRVLNSK